MFWTWLVRGQMSSRGWGQDQKQSNCSAERFKNNADDVKCVFSHPANLSLVGLGKKVLEANADSSIFVLTLGDTRFLKHDTHRKMHGSEQWWRNSASSRPSCDFPLWPTTPDLYTREVHNLASRLNSSPRFTFVPSYFRISWICGALQHGEDQTAAATA